MKRFIADLATTRRFAASAREHRPQFLSCKKMDMKVRNLLMAVEADVGEQAVTRRDEAEVARDL
jgi:hypothetical protein